MVNMLIRDLPEEVHEALRKKANGRGQSLQQYVTQELCRLASRRDIDEVLDAIERCEGGSVGFERAVENVRSERQQR